MSARPILKERKTSMIKIEKVEVFNWEGAIRGMRNPLNSWDKSDSEWEFVEDPSIINPNDEVKFVLGENDLALMRKLCRAGSDHRKFLRQIMVSMDITAPLYWWKEFDTYKVGTVANSCSTMHTIHKRELTMEDFSCEHLMPKEKQMLNVLINLLNEDIMVYNADTNQKAFWWQIIQLMPSSYNQKRTVTLNYEVLLNMYHARKAHKLDEWHEFCRWVESLPYAAELITGEAE
jgi:hypothetical protein